MGPVGSEKVIVCLPFVAAGEQDTIVVTGASATRLETSLRMLVAQSRPCDATAVEEAMMLWEQEQAAHQQTVNNRAVALAEMEHRLLEAESNLAQMADHFAETRRELDLSRRRKNILQDRITTYEHSDVGKMREELDILRGNLDRVTKRSRDVEEKLEREREKNASMYKELSAIRAGEEALAEFTSRSVNGTGNVPSRTLPR